MAAAELPALRDAEARAGAALHRLTAARDALAGEEKRAEQRADELRRRIVQMRGDIEREDSAGRRRRGVVERLDAEAEDAARRGGRRRRAEGGARGRSDAEAPRRRSPKPRSPPRRPRFADFAARRNALGARSTRRSGGWRRFEDELAALQARPRRAARRRGDERPSTRRGAALEELMATLAEAEGAALEAEERHAAAREAEARARAPLADAERAGATAGDRRRARWRSCSARRASEHGRRCVDEIVVARGYEAALGAALGDDLDASTDDGAPAHWAAPPARRRPGAARRVVSLAAHIRRRPQLARRLAQIGVVARGQGAALAGELKPGQRLV